MLRSGEGSAVPAARYGGVADAVRDAILVEGIDIDYLGADGARVSAVAGLSLSVAPGEFVTLIGPSGCGKTSVLRAIGGLHRPSAGSVSVHGSPVTGPRPDDVAFVFQDFALFGWRSALANVEIALELKGVPRRERRERSLDALARVGLADAAKRYPRELSGGMQQRVAMARALVSGCSVLLLDEPFGALDEQTRIVLGAELATLLEETSCTIVFVTHSLQEAVFLSDRVIVMGARPSSVRANLPIPLERPRHPDMMTSTVFQRLQTELFETLYDESSRALHTGGAR